MILVSSGAIAVGRKTIGMKERPTKLATKQACASIGQARSDDDLSETFHGIQSGGITGPDDEEHAGQRGEPDLNARNTFETLLTMGVIPIVNENDTISTYEIQFGDNDTPVREWSAALAQADLLILLSDIDGLLLRMTRNKNPDAEFIDYVEHVDHHFEQMGKGSASDVGNWRHVHKTEGGKACYFCGRGYGHCQRGRYGSDSSDCRWGTDWYPVQRKSDGRFLSHRLSG